MKRKMLFALVIAVMLTSITAIFVSASGLMASFALRPPPISPPSTLVSTDMDGVFANVLTIHVAIGGTEIGDQLGASHDTVVSFNGMRFVKTETQFNTRYTIRSVQATNFNGFDVYATINWLSVFQQDIASYPQLQIELADGTPILTASIGNNGDITPDRVTLGIAEGALGSTLTENAINIATYYEERYPDIYNWLVTFFEFRDLHELRARPWIEFYSDLSTLFTLGFGYLWEGWTPLTISFAVFFGTFTVTLLGAWLTNIIKRR